MMGKVIDITSRLKTINTDRLEPVQKQNNEVSNRINIDEFLDGTTLEDIMKMMEKFYK